MKSWLTGKDSDAGKDLRQNLSKLQYTVEDRGAWRAAVHGGPKELDMT